MAKEPRLAIESIAGQRPYQEDAVLAETLSDGRLLVAVADGMGGHAAGEVASALALETLVAALEDGLTFDAAFEKANAEVHDAAQDPGKRGMGTTLVAALVDDGEYMVANVGDSRGYLLSRSGIRQVTHDHSFAAEAARNNQQIAAEMAIRYKDALTRSIGTEGHVEVDVFGPFPVEDDTALLLCSDGLYKALEDHDLLRVFGRSGGAEGAAQALVSAAFQNGSDDNISVVIAEYGEVPRAAAMGTMPIDFVVPEADTVETPALPSPSTGAVAVGGDVTVSAAPARATSSGSVATAGVGDRRLPVGAIVMAVIAAVVAMVLYLTF